MSLVPPADRATALAIPRGVRPDRLHVTVAYVGRLGQLAPDISARVVGAAAETARCSPPLDVTVGELGRFGDRGSGVTWAAVEAPGLTELRDRLVDELAERGIPVDDRPFRPHLTLRYDRPGMVPPPRPRVVRFTARELWSVVGSDRRPCPFSGTEARPDPPRR